MKKILIILGLLSIILFISDILVSRGVTEKGDELGGSAYFGSISEGKYFVETENREYIEVDEEGWIKYYNLEKRVLIVHNSFMFIFSAFIILAGIKSLGFFKNNK